MSEFGDGLPAGTRIEEFEIVRELGRGGFGITYLARDHALHRLVAVKEYYPVDWSMRQAGGSIGPRSTTMAADYAWGLEKFVAEARVLARLDHPGIVKVHRIVEAAGSAYMAMEYIDGHSLAEEILSSGPLPPSRVRRLLMRLAEGLAEVHAAGLLHRDVKPANVMLRARDGSPVLIDFGAARQQMGHQSRSITTVLTPGYAPIEQYSKRGRQGPWTDVYALGAVGYAALSGRAPDDATERTMEDRLPPVDAVAPSPVSGELAGAVMAALATDLRERPRDMAELMSLLEAADVADMSGETGVAAAPAAESVLDSQADHSSGGSGALVPLAGGIADVPSESAAQERMIAASVSPARLGSRSNGRPRWPLWVGGGAGAAVVVVFLAWLAGQSGGTLTQSPSSDPDSMADAVEEALGLEGSEVQRIQRGLLELGFDPGEQDGLIGRGTREALRSWQADRGFQVTGYLGVNTADVLEHAGLEAFQADTAAEGRRLAEQARLVEEARLAEEARAERERLEDEARLAEEAERTFTGILRDMIASAPSHFRGFDGTPIPGYVECEVSTHIFDGFHFLNCLLSWSHGRVLAQVMDVLGVPADQGADDGERRSDWYADAGSCEVMVTLYRRDDGDVELVMDDEECEHTSRR